MKTRYKGYQILHRATGLTPMTETLYRVDPQGNVEVAPERPFNHAEPFHVAGTDWRPCAELPATAEYIGFYRDTTEPRPVQAITSADTSTKQVPALHKWYVRERLAGRAGTSLVVDLGAGRYDLGIDYVEDALRGVSVFPLDPYNRTPEENNIADAALCLSTDVLCANVLNVIAEPEVRAEVIETASRARTAYFSVYEGDRTGQGRATSKGWQANRKALSYYGELHRFFKHVSRKGNVFICWNS